MRASLGLGLLAVIAIGCGDDDGAPSRMDAGGGDSGATDGGPPGDGGGTCADDSDCDDGVHCNGGETCVMGGCAPGMAPDCDDGMECTFDECDEDARNCRHQSPDVDGDGHGDGTCGGDDCDDADAIRYPGAMEICDVDDRDEDCDPGTFGFRDLDMDAFPDAECCNGDTCGTDCNDALGIVHPTAPEACDGLDQNCNGMIDEGVLMTFYRDADGDGHGVAAEMVTGCFRPSGFADTADDCDDTRSGVNPGVPESCMTATIDDDCNGMINEGCVCVPPDSRTCDDPGRCSAGMETCVGGVWSACSIMPVAEVCNGEDDDCDGMTDEMLTIDCYPDIDDDGYPRAGTATPGCPVAGSGDRCGPSFSSRLPSGSTLDCDDTRPGVYPGASETCNHRDDDCDGMTDEGTQATIYTDADGDGHGEVTSMRLGCAGDPGTVTGPADDCWDRNANVFPGQMMYFGTPFCIAGGSMPCMTGGGWACRNAAGDACTGGTPSWDYDCSTNLMPPYQRIPSTAGCSGDCMRCGGTGWRYTGTPACGSSVTYLDCACRSGACSSGAFARVSPLPCR